MSDSFAERLVGEVVPTPCHMQTMLYTEVREEVINGWQHVVSRAISGEMLFDWLRLQPQRNFLQGKFRESLSGVIPSEHEIEVLKIARACTRCHGGPSGPNNLKDCPIAMDFLLQDIKQIGTVTDTTSGA